MFHALRAGITKMNERKNKKIKNKKTKQIGIIFGVVSFLCFWEGIDTGWATKLPAGGSPETNPKMCSCYLFYMEG
jgi:hypothetical protein